MNVQLNVDFALDEQANPLAAQVIDSSQRAPGRR